MKKYLKSVAAVLLAGIMLCCGTVTARAEIAPRWVNTDQAVTNLSFSGTTAQCTVSVSGKSGTTTIAGSAWLGRIEPSGSVTILKTWGNLTSNSRYLDFYNTYSVTKGYTYRLYFSGTVYRSGTGENVSCYTDTACY